MNAELTQPLPQPSLYAKLLACLSVATFWFVPFSPLVAIAAVRATTHITGWPRALATVGSCLAIAVVSWMTLAVLWIVYILVWHPASA